MQHYHHYRDLAEPKLELQRLEHELQLLWPAYQLIKRSLYKPALLILKAAMQDADHWLEEPLPQLTVWQQEWATHLRQRWEHHHGPIRGFVRQAPTDEKKNRQQLQFLLLWLARTAPLWGPEPPAKRPKNSKTA